nr:immunoglobulin light chain junction region [Macaca mulatta]
YYYCYSYTTTSTYIF